MTLTSFSDVSLTADRRLVIELHERIESALNRIGLLVRVFSRVKTPASIKKKLVTKGDYGTDKRMQDIFGVRIASYFPDDTTIIERALRDTFGPCEESKTPPDKDTFGPTRYNLVFRLPSDLVDESALVRSDKRLDSTFEVQVRTVLSEGWHEVEHDLRYKCKADWESDGDLSRALNGIVATLETCDWSMLKIFEVQAHRHYRARRWDAMLRSKFRVRMSDQELSVSLRAFLNEYPRFAKKLYRIDRSRFLSTLYASKWKHPLTLDSLVLLCNHLVLRDREILRCQTPLLTEQLLRLGAPSSSDE